MNKLTRSKIPPPPLASVEVLLSEMFQVEVAPAGTKSWEQCSPATPHRFEATDMLMGAVVTARVRGQAKEFRIVKTVRWALG